MSADATGVPLVIGVSLKMYFGHEQTLLWCRQVAEIAAKHPAVDNGQAEVVVLPTFPALAEAARIFEHTPVRLGAQDLFWEDSGAYTGEVSGSYLAELGCRFVEIGHAERRRIFAEDTTVLQAKVAAALRNALTPIICVGEAERGDPADAAALCIAQLEAALSTTLAGIRQGIDTTVRIVAAYEPEWAIGAAEPAPIEYISSVCAAIKRWLAEHDSLVDSQVIYGGSAGLDLLTKLNRSVDGLFLGRFAHDTRALTGILDEALHLVGAGIPTVRGDQDDWRERGTGRIRLA